MTSRDNYSHSLNHRGAADDIKRGLQRIKLAQIQVLRQLRKQDIDNSRNNHSLTYSKESTYDSKPLVKLDPEVTINKQKIQRLQTNIKQFSNKQLRLKRQNNILQEQVKRYKQLSQKAELKMKEYEKGEEKALAKAQQALSNAISSQKKFVTLKQEYDKTNRQRQRLINELKRLQKKQILDLLGPHQNQSQIPHKIVKELTSAHECFTQLMYQINSHKCLKKETNGKSTNQFQSTNTFTVSTYETQEKLDRNINNIIVYIKNLHTFSPISNARPSSFGNESNNNLQGSFKQDIKNLEQQLDRKSRAKIGEIQNDNKNLQKKLKKIQIQFKQCEQQNLLLKNKVKDLSKQLQKIKIDRRILEEEYEKFKKRTKQIEKIKEQEIEALKNKNRTLNAQRLQQINTGEIHKGEVNQQLLEDRIMDLQKQNLALLDKLNKAKSIQQPLKNIIQRLKMQVFNANQSRRQSQAELNFQINKLKAKVGIQSSLKNQSQWDQMVRTIAMLQQERLSYRTNQEELSGRLQLQEQKYKQKMSQMELEVSSLRSLVQQLRKQNAAFSFDISELTKLRNQQNSTKQSLNFNKKVEQLWGRKEGQYQNVNNILEQVKPHPQHQNQYQIVRNASSQPNIMIQQYPTNYQYGIQKIPISNMYISVNQQAQYHQGQQYPIPLQSYRINPSGGYMQR